MWRSADDAGKRAMLQRARDIRLPLHADLLKEDPVRMDELAKDVGLTPVYMTVVDAAGMRDIDPGVVSPEIAKEYRPRKWWHSAA